MYSMTAASPVLPIPCYVRVTNLENGREVIVKVNDRGPFALNRIIDLSYAAALKLGYQKKGTALVRVTSINTMVPAPHHAPNLYLQIGAFSNKSNAAKEKARASLLTQEPIQIISSHHWNGDIFKVQIGPLHGVGQSDLLLQRLIQAGYPRTFSIVK